MSTHGGAGCPRAGGPARRPLHGAPDPVGGGEDLAVPDSSDGDVELRQHRIGHAALAADYSHGSKASGLRQTALQGAAAEGSAGQAVGPRGAAGSEAEGPAGELA
eukprot:6234479-Lingulodinium_polyedra.AAC.1